MKFQITNKDKILFPKAKITKEDFIKYYEHISKWMIPLIKNRPISMSRFPNGIKGQTFFQKNISDYFPKWIKTKAVKRKGQSSINMVICNDKNTLLYLANQVCVLHTWLSKKDKLDIPDRLVFDLDPPGSNFTKIIEAAKDLKKLLDELKLKSFIMTTGSKGLHVIIPIKRDKSFEEVRTFAKKIAKVLVSRYPKKYTIETRKDKRKGRVFIDYLRNAFAQTAVAPFAVRDIENAPIATPLEWSEISKIHAQSFNIKNIKKRKKNPFARLNSTSCNLSLAMKRIDRMFKT